MTSRLRPGLTPRRRVEISGSQTDVDNNKALVHEYTVGCKPDGWQG
jgi:hypothetical protein